MAENQTEDEDDDMFGDFNFISNPNQNNRVDNNDDDDDDWGDFITTPKQDLFTNSHQLHPSNGFSFTPNFDSLTSTSDRWKLNHLESSKSLDSSFSSKWERPKGALPLSIFGGGEEEEDEADAAEDIFSTKSVSSVKKESNLVSSVSFNDIIGSLYGQKPINESKLNLFNDLNRESERIAVENGGIEQIEVENGLSLDLGEGNEEFEEDDWEFKDAVSEFKGADSGLGIKKEDVNLFDSWEIPTLAKKPYEVEIQGSPVGSTFGFTNSAQLDGEWFLASQEKGNSFNSYNAPTVVENGYHPESGSNVANIWEPDSLGQSKQIAVENGNDAYLANDNFDSDESFGDFKDSDESFGNFKDSVLKTEALDFSMGKKEEFKIGDQSDVKAKEPSVNDEYQGHDKASEDNRGALPLSIFSDSKVDSDESFFGQDLFSFKPSTSFRNGINSQLSSSNLSLNALISDLYSQADNVPVVSFTTEYTENEFSSDQGINSNMAKVEDDFDETTWEFKDAISETKTAHSTPVADLGQMHQNFPTESNITSFVDFYSRLKEESGSIILHHLDDLKNSQEVAALSGNATKSEALHEEIQTVHRKLVQEDVVSEDFYLKEHRPKNICVKELLGALEEPKFRVLESEYHLSHRILLAEQNLKSAVGLFEHAISVIKILNLGSERDLFSYFTTWSTLISACAQELKHGASIWKQSLQKNVHKKILSTSQGQRYIIALGEIYRVTEILKLSATIYRPWILSSFVDPIKMFASLEECSSIWSNSGIDEALRSLSNPVGTGYDGSGKELLESIKYIHNLSELDVTGPQNNVALPDQICRLSLLSSKMVPDVKMVLWNGESYFITLANFWANIISHDPPNLPSILVNL